MTEPEAFIEAQTSRALKAFIEAQTSRAIKHILRCKERYCDEHLPQEVSDQLRLAVLEGVNDFADALWHVVDSLSDNQVVLNQMYLDKLEEVYNHVVGDGAPDGYESPDDRSFRPTRPDPLTVGAGRVSGVTAKAVRRSKALTRHEYLASQAKDG